MQFGAFNLSEAKDGILAHTVRAGGTVFKKGTRLNDDDVVVLKNAGVQTVTAVKLDDGDVLEDQVAQTLARGLCGAGVEVSAPLAGRCNVRARHAGLVEIAPEAVDCINRAGHGVLVATLKPFEVVEPGRTIATIKVAPYALNRTSMDELVRCVQDSEALTVHPFKPQKIGLVLSHAPGQKESLLDKAHEVIAARLETYGSRIHIEKRCPHHMQDIAFAITNIINEVDVIMVLGAASPSDVKDVVPAAMVQAGGAVDVFGIPVDPGNLMVSGRLNNKPVLGLPGCARSPALNGVDLVFARLFAGHGLRAHDILGLGVGGLLEDVSERPQARETHVDQSEKGIQGVSAVVLAAGSSRRMGNDNKLLSLWQGKPLLRHVVETALASQVDEVVVVTGHDAANVRQVLSDLDVRFVHNPHYGEGLSTSLRAGVGAVNAELGGAAILLGDMPRLKTETLNALMARFAKGQGHDICVPRCHGRRGNPVIWPRAFYSDILAIAGDRGARVLLEQYTDRVVELVCEDTGVLVDVDTPADLVGLT